MSADSNYFINHTSTNYSLSCSHTSTDIFCFGHLMTSNQPFYHISFIKLAGFCLLAWRDGNKTSSDTCLALAARRITCGAALGVIALIGVVDAVARIVLALFTCAFQCSTVNSKKFLSEAFDELLYCLGFVTCFQVWNLYEEKLMTRL